MIMLPYLFGFMMVIVIISVLTKIVTIKIKNAPMKVGVWLVLLVIALSGIFGDYIIGRDKLQRLCMNDGGAREYETIKNVDGFILEGNVISPEIMLNASPYKAIEYVKDGKIQLSVKDSNGITSKLTDQFTLKYTVSMWNNTIIEPGFRKNSLIIKDNKNKILGKQEIFYYDGGWIKNMMPPSPEKCQEQEISDLELIKKILVPAEKVK